MELLDGLQVASLRELIKPLRNEITLPFTTQSEFTNVLLVDTAQNHSKSPIIDLIASQLEQPNGLTILLDSTYSWGRNSPLVKSLFSTLSPEQKKLLIVNQDVPSMGELIKCLRRISTGEWFQGQGAIELQPIKCIIIDNISTFKPTTDLEETTRQEYASLSKEIRKLQSQIGCSVVVKCWDRGYATGVMKRLSLETTTHKDPPSYWTGLPREITDGFDHVYYIQRVREQKYFGQYYLRGSPSPLPIQNSLLHI